MRAYDAVTSVLLRLDDEDSTVWSYEEILLYVKDGYNKLCRETKCLFDMHVIENVPPIGNWGTDLERHLIEQTPGMGLTDRRLHFTAEHERDTGTGGFVAGSTEGPVQGTAPVDAAHYEDFDIPVRVATSRLPDETVEVLRVTWDEIELTPEESAWMRQLDSQYEIREGGDPRHYTMDKDGLLTVRLVPPARGDAVYPTVVGSWGTQSEFSGLDLTSIGTWGILRDIDGVFPAGGPHGSPTRYHPVEKNTVVEIMRLGRSLDSHPFELPDSFVKFVEFWATSRALKRDSPGQDLKLSQHYAARYAMGVQRMTQVRLRKTNKEKVLKMGSMGMTDAPFDMGDPQPPAAFGRATGRRY